MEQDQPAEDVTTPKVLAAATIYGRRVELVDCADGRILILCDGAEQASYLQSSCNLESCTKAYMGLLRGAVDDKQEVESPL